jgi:hypothetical protein
MMNDTTNSILDRAFGPETKVESEELQSLSHDEYIDDTRSNIWYKIELLLKEIIPNDRLLSGDAKNRILNKTNLSRLEDLNKRMASSNSEYSSGRKLKIDLQGFLKTITEMHLEEKKGSFRRSKALLWLILFFDILTSSLEK